MKTKTNSMRFKFSAVFLFWLFAFVFIANAGTISIPASFSNVVQVIQRIFVTNDGTETGTPVMDINTGWSVVVYVPLLDAQGNPYITGAALTWETDPLWSAVSGDYLTQETDPIFGDHAASNVTSLWISHRNTAYGRGNHATQWYLTSFTESDPIWSVVSTNYYDKTGVDLLIESVRAGMAYQGLWDYSTGELPSNVSKWDMYEISVTGTWYNGLDLYIRDIIIAKDNISGPTAATDWSVIIMDANPNIDPFFTTSAAYSISSTDILHRTDAYNRWNHANQSYLTWEADPTWNADKAYYYNKSQIDNFLASLAGWLRYMWGRDYSGGELPQDTTLWDMYIIIDEWNFNGLELRAGDEIIANTGVVWATSTGDWDVIEKHTDESDPVFTASAAGAITPTQTSNRDTAYNRGNHADEGYLTEETDSIFLASSAWSITNTHITNWNSAYSRGNHASQWYLTDETDAVFLASPAHSITSWNIYNWNTAYSRGNHATRWYITWESDPIRALEKTGYYTKTQINNMGYITGYTESDPIRNAQKTSYVPLSMTGNWNTAYTRGNHALIGYLTGYTESDPVFGAHAAANVTAGKISNWDTAYSRGNHATRGYLTGYTETDPQVGTLEAGKGCYATGGQVVCDQDFTYNETDPIFMANSGDYYLASNPAGYITAASNVWSISGSTILNTNTGNVVVSGHLNIWWTSNLYPLYVWADNAEDDRENYITIDAPVDQEKWFQIGWWATTSDFERARYTEADDDGDMTYFMNGRSERDILTLGAWGRIGFNIPTLLWSKTPPDGFSIYPQYFDSVLRYDGDTYYDLSEAAYSSAGAASVVLSSATDVLLIGKEYPRRATYIAIDTPAGTPGDLEVSYSKSWDERGEVVWLADTTNELREPGNVSWNLAAFKSTREKRTISGYNLYWIQISLSSLAGDLPTASVISNLGVNRFALYAAAGDINPMFTVDSSARLGILPPELTGKYVMGTLPGLTSTQVEIVSNNPLRSDVLSYVATDETGAWAVFMSARSRGTVDNKMAVSTSDFLWWILWYGYDGAEFTDAAGILFSVDGTPDILDMPSKISFYTTPDGDEDAVERMTIRHNWRVGIGTTTPSQFLTVAGNINVTSGYDVYDGSGNAYVTMADLSGHLIEESDPIWSLDKPNYYTSLEIDNALASLAGGLVYNGTRDYSGGDLPTDVSFGDMYIIVNSWDYNGLLLNDGDQIIANTGVAWATNTGDRDVIQKNTQETDPIFSASLAFGITSTNIGQWNTAYSRGNHALMGYLTSFTEADPVFAASPAWAITPTNITHWNTAYTWWNHATMWYLTSFTESDPVWNAQKSSYVSLSMTGNWNTAYSRGNHASAGYLTSASLSNYITGWALASYVPLSMTGNWNTAFWRGNHALMGYLTWWSLTNYYTKSEIDALIGGGQFGGGSSYSYFEADGTLVFTGDATVRGDVNVWMIMWAWGSSPDLLALSGSTIMMPCYDGNTTMEQVYGSIELEHDWKEGTPFYAHLHIVAANNVNSKAGTGRFYILYSIIPTNGAATAPVTLSVDTYFPAGEFWDSKMPHFPAIALTGYHVGDQISFRVYRLPTDAADTYTNDICMTSFGFHYEKDTVWSRQMASK